MSINSANERGRCYYGARYYDPKTSVFLGVDPMSDKYPGLSPFVYCADNPIMLIDPTGMSTEVVVCGPDADNVVAALNASSSLKITKDQNGKLSATGKAKSANDKALLEAIKSPDVVVNVETTKSEQYKASDGSTQWFLPSSLDASNILPNGQSEVNTQLNFEGASKISGLVGEKVGETISHEIKEAFAFGIMFKGQSRNDANYTTSHNKASETDRIKSPKLRFGENGRQDPRFLLLEGTGNGGKTWERIYNKPTR